MSKYVTENRIYYTGGYLCTFNTKPIHFYIYKYIYFLHTYGKNVVTFVIVVKCLFGFNIQGITFN